MSVPPCASGHGGLFAEHLPLWRERLGALKASLAATGRRRGLTLILMLGSTNDEALKLDAEMEGRIQLACDLLRSGTKECPAVLMPSGWHSCEWFNRTSTPQWQISAGRADVLLADHKAESGTGLFLPGLPGCHTVGEAVLLHMLVSQLLVPELTGLVEALHVHVVTGEFHRERSDHLFRTVIAALPQADKAADGVAVDFQMSCAPTVMAGKELEGRLQHEKKGLETLRSNPFGEWKDWQEGIGYHK